MRVEILDREGAPSCVLLDGKYHDSVCAEFASWFREAFPVGHADGREVWRKIPRSGWLTYFLADFDELEDQIVSVTDSNMIDPVVDPEVCDRIRQLISLEMVIAAVRRSQSVGPSPVIQVAVGPAAPVREGPAPSLAP